MQMTTATYGLLVEGFLRKNFGTLRNASKHVARLAGVSPRTAEKWLAGNAAPRGPELLNMMMQCDALAAEIFKLVQESKNVGIASD